MAITTIPVELSADEKAARELTAALLDARRNLATLGREVESSTKKKKDAVLRELGKATTGDQMVAVAKTALTTFELLDREAVAIEEAEKLVRKRFEQLESESAAVLLSVYTERHDRIKSELARSADTNKPLNDELKRLSDDIANLTGRKKPVTAP